MHTMVLGTGGMQAFGRAAWSFLTNEDAPGADTRAVHTPADLAWYIIIKLQGEPMHPQEQQSCTGCYAFELAL